MSFQQKYLKYKKKYLNLKNIQKGGNYNHIIALLWFNRNRTTIEQFSPTGQNLQIKKKIKRTYNLFKKTYYNQNVILFLNYDKIVDEDFEFFRSNNIITEDINNFEVIKSNEHLLKLFNPDEYNISHCSIYIYVDMLKILIQYECMVYKNFDYVVFSDLDIQDYNSLDVNDLICTNRHDFIDKYYPKRILDKNTLILLDNFGYLMVGFGNNRDIKNDKDNLNKSRQYLIDMYNIMIIGDKYYKNMVSFAENGFMITKKDPNVIKAIKDFFIDFYFKNFVDNCLRLDNNYIYNLYPAFFSYLYFLKEYSTFDILISNEELNEIKNNFDYNIDYINNNKNSFTANKSYITILSLKLLEHFIQKYNEYPFSTDHHMNGITGRIRFDDSNYTTKGRKIRKQFHMYITQSSYNVPFISFKCVAIGKQKNSA